MKIGLIHHEYSSKIPSGENLTVQRLIGNLSKEFGEIHLWTGSISEKIFSKDSLWVFLFRQLIFDYKKNAFDKWLSNCSAVQIHNNFPLLTRSNLKSLRKFGKHRKINRVVHNYRPSCLRGTQYRNNSKCTLCSCRSFTPGILRACYKKNHILSLIVARNTQLLNQIIIESKVHQYIAVSPSISEYLKEFVDDHLKVVTITNRIKEPIRAISPNAKEVLYLGRLDPEKDFLNFLKYWVSQLETGIVLPLLNIVGTGTLDKPARYLVRKYPDKILIHGYLTGVALENVVEKCKIFIFTSAWMEPFGRTIIEAAARGMYLVGTENPILRSLINNRINGIIISDDYSDLVESINLGLDSIFSNHFEESKRRFREMYSDTHEDDLWINLYRNRDNLDRD